LSRTLCQLYVYRLPLSLFNIHPPPRSTLFPYTTLFRSQDFDRVVISNDQAYGWVGSSYALSRECVRLAAALEMPNDLLLDYESERFIKAIQSAQVAQRKGWALFRSKPTPGAPWEQHPIAAMLCAKLHGFAGHSVETGALLVFC